MQLPAGINRRYAFFLSLTLIFLWLWVAFDRPTKFTSFTYLSHRPNPATDAFDFPVVDEQAIRDVCAATEWNASLVFTCDNNHGGVGHVRNSILNCVRYAIAAGASLVLPNIALRDMDEDDEITGLNRRHGPGRRGMEYMFDKQHFVESLKKSCPQMKIIKEMDSFYSERRRALLPENLVTNLPASGLEHPAQWPDLFHTWVQKHISPTPLSEPIIIDLEQSFLTYPTSSDSPAFAHSFGSLLKPHPAIRALATSTLKALSTWYDIPLNLTSPILTPSFFGAHLKTTPNEIFSNKKRHEVAEPFTHYTAQATAYLEHASASHLSILYIASGNLSSILLLQHQASGFNIDVTHKFELLKNSEREALEKLKWDQRAVVDFLVLSKAQEFAGVGHSSFSWNVALKREFAGEEAEVRGGKWEDGVWRDGRSTLYGVRESYVGSAGCLWE